MLFSLNQSDDSPERLLNMRRIVLLLFVKVSGVIGKFGLRKLRSARVAHSYLLRFFRSHLKPAFVIIRGNKIFLDAHDSANLSVRFTYEPIGTMVLEREINKGDVVLDLGAHIGYYTLLTAELVGNRGKVFAFEPGPDNFALLEKNVAANGYKNVILTAKAVSDKSGEIKLFLAEESSVSHRIGDPGDGRKTIYVEAITIDDFFQDYNGKVNFIKMDIEGAEAKALQGMRGLLRKNKKIKLMTEFYPSALRNSGTTPEDYFILLSQLGFQINQIDEKYEKCEPVDIDKLMSWVNSGGLITNLLCIRS